MQSEGILYLKNDIESLLLDLKPDISEEKKLVHILNTNIKGLILHDKISFILMTHMGGWLSSVIDAIMMYSVSDEHIDMISPRTRRNFAIKQIEKLCNMLVKNAHPAIDESMEAVRKLSNVTRSLSSPSCRMIATQFDSEIQNVEDESDKYNFATREIDEKPITETIEMPHAGAQLQLEKLIVHTMQMSETIIEETSENDCEEKFEENPIKEEKFEEKPIEEEKFEEKPVEEKPTEEEKQKVDEEKKEEATDAKKETKKKSKAAKKKKSAPKAELIEETKVEAVEAVEAVETNVETKVEAVESKVEAVKEEKPEAKKSRPTLSTSFTKNENAQEEEEDEEEEEEDHKDWVTLVKKTVAPKHAVQYDAVSKVSAIRMRNDIVPKFCIRNGFFNNNFYKSNFPKTEKIDGAPPNALLIAMANFYAAEQGQKMTLENFIMFVQSLSSFLDKHLGNRYDNMAYEIITCGPNEQGINYQLIPKISFAKGRSFYVNAKPIIQEKGWSLQYDLSAYKHVYRVHENHSTVHAFNEQLGLVEYYYIPFQLYGKELPVSRMYDVVKSFIPKVFKYSK